MRFLSLFLAVFLLAMLESQAIVFLNTSEAPVDSLPKWPRDSVVQVVEPQSTAPPDSSMPKVGSVLFLSGSDQRVWMAIGVLRGLAEMHRAPDLLVVEGAAALPAMAYILGYPMKSIYQWMDTIYRGTNGLNKPRSNASPNPDWMQEEALPWQVQLSPDHSLILKSSSPTVDPCFSNSLLSWQISQLERQGPNPYNPNSGGPKIAFQVLETQTGIPKLVFPGNLGELAKVSILNPNCWDFEEDPPKMLDGSILSHGNPFTEAWSMHAEHLVDVKVPAKFILSPMIATSESVLDSVLQKWKYPSQKHGANAPQVFSLALNWESGFKQDTAAAWEEMGYQSVIRSQEILQGFFKPWFASPQPKLPLVDEKDLWTNAMVVPKGSGEFHLLRYRLAALSPGKTPQDWLNELGQGDFYSHIKLEWQPFQQERDYEVLSISAKEVPKVRILGAASNKFLGQPVHAIHPEVLASLSWSEPSYLPFKLEGAFLIGGSHPGWGGQFFVEPPGQYWLRLSYYQLRIFHEWNPPNSEWKKAGAYAVAIDEELDGLRVFWGATIRQYLLLEINRKTLYNRIPDPLVENNPAFSTHFKAGFHYEDAPSQELHWGTDWMTTYLVPAELTGILRDKELKLKGSWELIFHGLETFGRVQSNIRYRFKDSLEFVDYVSWDVFDKWNTGSASPLSFGSEIWLDQWRQQHYGLAGGGVNFHWQQLGIRIVGGLVGVADPESTKEWKLNQTPFWEAGLAYPSPVGVWRLMMGGFDTFGPFFGIQWGYNLNLESLFLHSVY